MANELNIALAESGKNVTAQRYQSGAAVGSPISLTEISNSGFYSGNMTGSTGTYFLVFNDGIENVGSGSIMWDGTAEVATSTLTAPQIRSELSVELGRLDATISSRLAPNGTLATVTTLTNAPSTPPTAGDIASAVWAAADKTGYSLTSAERSAIAAAVEGSLLNEGDGQAVLNAIVEAIGNQNLSEVSLVAAIRSDLERTGGKIDSIPTSSAPSASTVAGAVRTELATELGRLDASVSSRLSPSGTLATVTNLTNAPASVTPADIWDYNARTLTSASGPTAVEIRQEIDANSTKLDAAVSTRLAGSAYTAPANSDVAAIKTKTDAINVDRINNTATTAIVGNLLAQANS